MPHCPVSPAFFTTSLCCGVQSSALTIHSSHEARPADHNHGRPIGRPYNRQTPRPYPRCGRPGQQQALALKQLMYLPLFPKTCAGRRAIVCSHNPLIPRGAASHAPTVDHNYGRPGGRPYNRQTPRPYPRCGHPGQQQGRRLPSISSSQVRRIRLARVSGFLADSIQQINSFLAKGVIDCHNSCTCASAISA